MGWCGGTYVFDNVVEALITDRPLNKKQIIVDLIKVLEDKDWDCQSDSEFIGHPLVREAFIEVDPEWAEYFEEIDEDS